MMSNVSSTAPEVQGKGTTTDAQPDVAVSVSSFTASAEQSTDDTSLPGVDTATDASASTILAEPSVGPASSLIASARENTNDSKHLAEGPSSNITIGLTQGEKVALEQVSAIARHLSVLVWKMKEHRLFHSVRPFGMDTLNNLYEYGCSNHYEKCSSQTRNVSIFLGEQLSRCKKATPVLHLYQALLIMFGGESQIKAHPISSYMFSKQGKETVLSKFEKDFLPELNSYIENCMTLHLQRYMETQARRYQQLPAHPDDVEMHDWTQNSCLPAEYTYTKDAPNFSKTALFKERKRYHDEVARRCDSGGFFVMFYTFLAKNSKNKPILNSDFAYFTKYEKNFVEAMECEYICSMLKFWVEL